MIKAHAQMVDIRLPRIGVVRKGGEKPERGPGRDLDHFRLDTKRATAEVIAAWNEVIGPEPKAVSGILPYADPADNLSIWDELWQGKRLLWRGDGDRLHVELNGDRYVRYAPGEGPPQPAAAGEMVGKGKAARISRLALLLPQTRIAGIFEFMSSSVIDADELWRNLMWVRQNVQTLQGAPVTVFRSAQQFNVEINGRQSAVTKYMLHLTLDGRFLDALMPTPALPGALRPPVQVPALPAGEDAPDDDEAEFEDAEPDAQELAQLAAELGGVVTIPGPRPDDEQAILDASAREFLALAAELLQLEPDDVKQALVDKGLTGIPGKPDDRLALYRSLRAEIDATPDGNEALAYE